MDGAPAQGEGAGGGAPVGGPDPRPGGPAAGDRHDQLVLSCEAECADDIIGAGASGDEGGTLVRHRIPDDARGVVLSIVGPDQPAREIFEGRRRHLIPTRPARYASWATSPHGGEVN